MTNNNDKSEIKSLVLGLEIGQYGVDIPKRRS